MTKSNGVISGALLLCVAILAFACAEDANDGGLQDTGLDADLYLNELNGAQVETVCRWRSDVLAKTGAASACEPDGDMDFDVEPMGEIEMEGEVVMPDELETGDMASYDDCLESPLFTQHCRLGDMESCLLAAHDDPCGYEDSPDCDALNACLSGADPNNPPDNFFSLCDPKGLFCKCYTNVQYTRTLWGMAPDYSNANEAIVAVDTKPIAFCFEPRRLKCLPCREWDSMIAACEAQISGPPDVKCVSIFSL